MRLDQPFSVDSVPVSTSNYDPIPAGWYNAVINGAEVKSTKAGTGKYLNMRYDITGENHAGRVVFGMITVQNPNTTAETIGQQQLGELCRAIGKAVLNDTDELLGATLSIKVAISAREGYDPRNEVKGFKALKGGMPSVPSAPAQSSGKAPWDAPF
jgi:hypothetical protein